MRVRSGTISRLWALALLIVASNTMFAAEWYVTTTGAGNGTGSSWANAANSINYMVNDASVVSGDIINIKGGTYTEQVVIGNKSVTLLGSQNNGQRTIITSPSSLTGYQFTVALSWNGAGKLSSNTIKPIVFVNATSNTITVDIKRIDIDGSTYGVGGNGDANVFVGLAYRYAGGVVGGSAADSVHISNIQTPSWTDATNNAFASMILTRSTVRFSHVGIDNYRNAGIAIVGENTSSMSSVIANQPNPVIEDCRIEGNTNGLGSSDANTIQAGILIANGGRSSLHRNLISKNRTGTGNDGTGRFAYGIYLYDARKNIIGDQTSNKSNGNLVTDNEIALYVRMTVSTLNASDYTIRQNTFAYNGNITASGKIADYSTTTAAFTSYGYVRFDHTPGTNATLTVASNAWGNGEATSFYSYSTAPYNAAAYAANRVAYWRGTAGDVITYTMPLSPNSNDTLLVSANNGPMDATSPSTVNGMGVNLGFGFYNFDQLHRAVYAASGPNSFTPQILVQDDLTEDEPVIITKAVRAFSKRGGNNCSTQPSVQLGLNVQGPTVWVYGTSTAAFNNDAVSRYPNGVKLDSLRLVGNNVQAAGGTATGPAMLVTGSTTGANAPQGTRLTKCSIDSLVFDGAPYVFSTSQDGNIAHTMRYSPYVAGVTDIYALYTSYAGACEQFVIDPDVLDYRDDASLALIHLDQVVNVSNCVQLQNAINAASGIRTTIRAINDIFLCDAYINNTSPITFDVIATKTLELRTITINSGVNSIFGQGGTDAVCDAKRDEYLAGNMNVRRVNVFPPACLQGAINLLDDDIITPAVLVAASGNLIDGSLAFVQSGDSVNIHTGFDYYGATYSSATNLLVGTISGDEARFNGRFTLRSGADVQEVAGSITSNRGSSFGDGTDFNTSNNQVELNFSNGFLPNCGRTATGMALQFVGSTGNKRLELTDEEYNHSVETPTIFKQVFLYGQDNRGTSMGTITLNGSGNCPVGGPDEGSVLRNLSVATVDIYSASECVQAALGRVIDCDISLQHIEGVGTSPADGSGGTVNLDPFSSSYIFNQNLEIAKDVTLNENANAELGTGTLTLRRGADIGGSASFFAPYTLMTQCYPYHSSGANPSMSQAMNLAGTGNGYSITLAGYGNSNPVGTGSDPRGVWQFQNITVNRDVDIKGTNAGISSNLLTTDCSLISSSTFPSVNAGRDLNVETVIGGNLSNSYNAPSGLIFYINDSGASIDGISFRNITGGFPQTAVYIRDGRNTVAVNNNILNSDKSNSLGLVSNDGGGASLSNIDVNNNHVLVTNSTMGAMGAPIFLMNLTDASGQNEVIGNAINVSNAGAGVVMWLQSVNNASPTGSLIQNNWFSGGTSHGMFLISNAVGLNGITVERNRIRNGFGQGIQVDVANIDPGANGLTIRENIIDNQANGIVLSGNYSSMNTNRIFINNNDLSGNTSGVNIIGTTNNSASTNNMFDLRFNWWGSDLGPQRGAGVATNPLLAPSDSARIIGHVPFNHNSGANIEDANGITHGRWMLYPVAVTSNDGSATCGWQYQTMQGAVLRVNAAGNTLLGTYDRITWAKDNTNPQAYPAVTGPRSGTDQIFVIAQSTYGSTFGYNGAVESEGSGVYPIVFSADPEPSVIRGINRPTIFTDESGSILVTATFPRGFTAKDFINHVSNGVGFYRGIQFANEFNNTVDYNYFTSLQAFPALFTGILCNNTALNLAQTFTNNRINLGQSPRWPGGPVAGVSTPATFSGIVVPNHGGNGSVNISNNVISVASSAPKAVGIYVNAANNIINSVTVSGNQLRKMSASLINANRSLQWGTGIYISGGNNIQANTNDIQGTSGVGFGHDGITLDKPGTASVNTNTISTLVGQNLSGLNATTNRERGYGIKIFSATGSDAIGSVTINGNTIGSSATFAPEVASIYVGGTSSTIASSGSPVVISSNTIQNATSNSNAAIQIATTQYTGATSAGYVNITGNTIGTTTSGESNAMFLAIGTDGIGSTRNANADAMAVNVSGNAIRTSQQAVIPGATREVADGRPNAGANIRNIFGYGTGIATNGANTVGGGLSGNNTFTHATILTGEAGLANYATALPRTSNAVAFSTPATTPVTIERLIANTLSAAQNADSANTVELRENSGWVIGSENLYYKETLTFPDRRILINGPRNGSYAELLAGAGGIGTMFTSTGRENKDIRGAIRINTIGAGMYGEVSVGAANKGDVYMQLDNVGVDTRPVAFRYHGAALASLAAVVGLNNGLVKATDIKASMDDADDDNYIANASTSRRTGVFRSGTAASQFLKGNNADITGTTPLNVFPNPASGDVTVAFTVPFEGMVRVALYNSLGQKVTDLREGNLSADAYTTSFDASNLPSGTYHVRLVHDLYTITAPVSVIK